jgi:putative ABC transport system permease protein
MILVFIAALIALPFSYYFLDQWLNNFAYRINLPVDILFASFLCSAFLASVAVGIKSLRAASANPVDSIRTE